MNLYRFLRYRYPYTACTVLYVAAAVTMVWFVPLRKAGELMLLALSVAFVSVAAGRRR